MIRCQCAHSFETRNNIYFILIFFHIKVGSDERWLCVESGQENSVSVWSWSEVVTHSNKTIHPLDLSISLASVAIGLGSNADKQIPGCFFNIGTWGSLTDVTEHTE